ncbi:hypothetical protein [Magnetospira sp. QH-2]|uniref:hypothetical protein n=1 Tax=Magnetospira sp. (strain QH-2) TaxID=1288970 RepID=UPI0003E81A71|nr:hypothetical protein [Magnetospira sp. QH-2]CCQ75469.1 protein of unknown function [Magnetospira sp. QH-2]
MRRVLLFLMVTAVLLGTIHFLEDVIPETNPFSEDRPAIPHTVDGYGEHQMARMKIRQAVRRDTPYDVGLFGNSRILSVERQSLGQESCSLFNFALSGQSFRSTVDLLRELASVNRLPRVVIISLDHFELQLYNNTEWTGWRRRMATLKADLAAVAREPSGDLREAMRILWRHAWTESLLFRRQFEALFVRRSLLNIFGPTADQMPVALKGQGGYRPDGSHQPPTAPVTNLPPLTRHTPQIIDTILRRDLHRLKKLERRHGLRILIYESPLHPASRAVFDHQPSVFAVNNRKTFLETCANLNLACFSAESVLLPPVTGWTDASHPPAAALGQWIGSVALPEVGGCGS